MASSSRTYKRSRYGTRSQQSHDNQPDDDAFARFQNLDQPLQIAQHPFHPPNIIFRNAAQEERYQVLSQKPRAAQRFVDLAALRELHIHNQIRTLFENIGWGGVLDLHAQSFTAPTLEVLSSIAFSKVTHILTFRLFNREYAVNVDELCHLINAPIESTYVAHIRSEAFYKDRAKFWKVLTGLREYNSSAAKASMLIHPVVRIAHRIICNIFFAQEETSKCGLRELEILWAMIYRPQPMPNFGHWLVSKLLKVANRDDGQIHCGGIVTLLARLPSVNVHLSNDLDEIAGDTRLRLTMLSSMHIIRKNGREVFWLVNGRDHLRIDSRNHQMLNLETPTSATNWRLDSNVGESTSRRPNRRQQIQESDDEEEQHFDIPAASPPHHQSPHQHHQSPHPHHPSSSQQYHAGSSSDYASYMAELARVQASVNALREDVATYHTELDYIDNNHVEFTYRVDDFIESQTLHNTRVNDYMQEQRLHNSDMLSLLTNFRNVHVGDSSSHNQPPLNQQFRNPNLQPLQPPYPFPYPPPHFPFPPPNP